MVQGALTAFWDWVDRRHIVRRSAFFVCLWLTIDSYYRGWDYATTSDKPGFELAAIIGAILLPVSGLMKFTLDAYNLARKGNDQ